MAHRPSPFDNPTGRQSPFRRQNSASPATVRGGTPGSSPTKTPAPLSPIKSNTLSPEKTSPFVRRPSQINHASDRPSSPFARPNSSLSIPASPSRKTSNTSDIEAPLSPALKSPTAPLSPAPRSLRQPSVEPDTPAHPTSLQPSIEPDTPTITSRSPPTTYDGARPSSEEPPLDSPFFIPPSPANLRPTAHRTTTSSTTATIKPPVFTPQAPKPGGGPITAPKLNNISGGAYNHIPQPLLHSMRESFEVLDSANTGSITSASVSEMLSQLGLDNTPSSLKNFFPPSSPSQLNLARYLDVLSGPLADLSASDELRAAFEAFDVDDSGQIDISTLRDALLHTAPQPGEEMIRLSEREVDGILGEFSGRRAFGAKGMNASKGGKGEVFKYRDFMANVSGSSGVNGAEAPVAV